MKNSNKLKQLMQVILVVFMSLTMIVPNGLAKAENQYLSTDKTSYAYGEAVTVTVSGYPLADKDSTWTWVGLYPINEDYTTGSDTTSWYYLTTSDPVNLLNPKPSVGNDNGNVNYQSKIDKGGQFYVVLYGTDGVSVVGDPIIITLEAKPETDNQYLFTDKTSYAYGEPVMVTVKEYTLADEENTWTWVGLYKANESPAPKVSTSWYYLISHDAVNIISDADCRANHGQLNHQFKLDEGGDFKVILFNVNGGWGDILETVDIHIEPKPIAPSTLNLDLDNAVYADTTKNIYAYRYGDPVNVIAFSERTGAWVGLVKRYDNVDKYYYYYYPADHNGEAFNIFDADKGNQSGVVAADTTVDNLMDYLAQEVDEITKVPGRYNVVLFKSGYDVELIMPIILLKVYDLKSWSIEEDFSKATATFESTDDATKKYLDATSITSQVTTAPKCEEEGERTYTITVDTGNAFETKTKDHVFTTTRTAVEPATGHVWGEWEVITPATEDTEGLQRRVCKNDPTHIQEEVIPKLSHVHVPTVVEAKEPTCTENGNIKYYVCEGCGQFFSDEACTQKLNAEDVVIRALGHNYGSWTFDETNHNHYKECTRCKDRIVEDCSFEDKLSGGSVIHTCSVCKGSYEEKFFWTDKTEYKQFEPIVTHVNLDLVKKFFNNLDVDTAWVGLYGDGITPTDNVSTRWHYVKNMGTPEKGFDMLTILDKPDHPEEGGSGSTNSREWVLTTPGPLHLYLFGDNGFDIVMAHLVVTLGEDTLECGNVTFEFDGKDPAVGETIKYELPLEKDIEFKATVEGDPYGSWFGIYDGEFGQDYDLSTIKALTYWYLRNCNGEHRTINEYIEKPGKYTLVLFGTGGYEGMREFFYVEVSKKIKSEETTKEPTCTEPGNRKVTYEDDTYENIQIPALGHDWGEWIFDEDTHTHHKNCSRCQELVIEDCKFNSVTEGDIITYTCEVCGGQYTYHKTVADEDVFRAAGNNRYLTALNAADVFMEKTGKESLDTVVLACGSNFADALAGSYLAAVKNAPIVLIDDNEKAPTVEAYLKENVTKGGLIYILGGEKAIAKKFESNLKKSGFNVKRLAGNNRYGTNLEILKEAGIQGDAILVSTGTNFADSLSASASGLPVLLVKDKLSAEQKDFLSNYSGKRIYILGGTNAVNKTVEGEMGEYGTVKRISGDNRYDTSAKIAKQFFGNADTIVIAVGDNFPDGLCGGALAFQLGAPVVLVKDGRIEYAQKLVKDLSIEKAVVLGGTNALKDKLINEILGHDPKEVIKVYE